MAEPTTTIRHDTGQRHLHKYRNRNPIHRLTLGRFFAAVAAEIQRLQPACTLELGCGEGLLLQQLRVRGAVLGSYTGIDLRPDALEHARLLHPHDRFKLQDLLTWEQSPDSYDLVIASQVLEHLPHPGPYLERLVLLARHWLLLTVPWEPWFRLMNLLRGRDIGCLGNHPEHVNLWGFNAFRELIGRHARVLHAFTVFPFSIVVAEKVPPVRLASPERDPASG